MSKFSKTHAIQTFVVVGSGTFPFDMLRYDSAWPAAESDSYRIAEDSKTRTVVLRRAQIDSGSFPTLARWKSYGWRVTLVGDRKVPL